ncbi:hypothetical protein D3C71_1039710 [compost metagenome]
MPSMPSTQKKAWCSTTCSPWWARRWCRASRCSPTMQATTRAARARPRAIPRCTPTWGCPSMRRANWWPWWAWPIGPRGIRRQTCSFSSPCSTPWASWKWPAEPSWRAARLRWNSRAPARCWRRRRAPSKARWPACRKALPTWMRRDVSGSTTGAIWSCSTCPNPCWPPSPKSRTWCGFRPNGAISAPDLS